MRQKVLSLVPSWTETLVESGLNVVGRTRFCIHPESKIKNIPIVGGTKNFDIDEILKLKPDVVILDKEENRKEMADELQKNGIQLEVSHVLKLEDAINFLAYLSELFISKALSDLADQYHRVSIQKMSFEKFLNNAVIKKNANLSTKNLQYVIWKNPYMVVSADTFIADVLSRFGLQLEVANVSADKYPVIGEENLKQSYCLFSSEPYPFSREFEKLANEGFKGALVDGEKISWYGIRNLRFLQNCVE